MSASRTMDVTRRSDRSLYMAVLQKVIKPFKSWLIPPKKEYPAGSPQVDVSRAARSACHVKERKVEDIYVYDMNAKSKPAKFINGKDKFKSAQTETSRGQRIIYFNGGSFQMPPTPQHWKFCAALATRLPQSTVSVVSMPLAPAQKAPITFPHLVNLVRTLLRQAHKANEDVVLMGDSSGGNVALSTLMQLLQDDADGKGALEHPPLAVALISPAVDLANNNFEMQKIERNDAILTVKFTGEVADAWRGEWDGDDPRVSPVNSDHTLLKTKGVRVIAVTGGYDVLSPDALVLLEKCTDAEVRGEWLHWEKQMHCFPLAFSYGLRESREGLEWIVQRLEKVWVAGNS